MLESQREINDCYILQSRLGEDELFERWSASAIYSPSRFLLRFLREGVLSPGEAEALRLEAMRCFALESEAVDRLIEADLFMDRLFLCTEYRGERPLAEPGAGGGAFPARDAAALALRLADGLRVLHDRGMAYGCLEPRNVMTTPGIRPPAGTWLRLPGCAAVGASARAAQLAAHADDRFRAPELSAGGAPSPLSDIYALGAFLGWLAGKTPPAALAAVAGKATEPDPARRHPDARRLMDELEACLKSLSAEERDGAMTAAAEAPQPGSEPSLLRAQARMPEAAPRVEVVKYFQELSADYLVSQRRDLPAAGIDAPVKTSSQAPARDAGGPARGAQPSPDPFAGFGRDRSVQPGAGMAGAAGGDSVASGAAPRMGNAVKDDAAAAPGAMEAGSATDRPAAAQPAARGALRGEATAAAAASSWKYRTASFEQVLDTLAGSARRARGGRGDLRFIEEPDTEAAGERLDALLGELSAWAMVVDVGSMLRFGTADVTDFLVAARQALARALAGESRQALLRFGRKAEALGVRGFFGGYPLGRLIYGADGAEDAVGEGSYAAIAEALTWFGRRRRPLVLVVRGGECLQRGLTEFLLLMVSSLRTKPACVFVFGEDFPPSLRSWRKA